LLFFAKVNSVKTTAVTMNIRCWLIDLLKQHTTGPNYVWDLMSVAETIWQWRGVIQALSLFYQVYAKAANWPVWLFSKAVFTMGRAFNVHDKLFSASCPMLHLGWRLLGLACDFWEAYPYLKVFWNAVHAMHGARTSGP
jgi:hypothetical protein